MLALCSEQGSASKSFGALDTITQTYGHGLHLWSLRFSSNMILGHLRARIARHTYL